MVPTLQPTLAPTLAPTLVPTGQPTSQPTLAPTLAPTLVPTRQPSLGPTLEPSLVPSIQPTLAPSLTPTLKPTMVPTLTPTLNTSVEAAPPNLLGAVFSSSGATIVVEFSKDTDLGATAGLATASFECTRLFNFTGISQSCAWKSDSQVSLTLGSDSVLVPGDTVTLLPGVLKAACTASSEALCRNNSYAGVQDTTIASPPSSVAPIIIAIYAGQISKCDDAKIDVSGSLGSGGRPFEYSWQLRNASIPYPASLVAKITGTNTSTLSVPSELLTPGRTYNLTLSLHNFLGGNASEDVSFRVSEEAIPSLTLSGPSSIAVYDDMEIIAEASSQSCNSSAAITTSIILTYSWKVIGQEELKSTSPNPRVFKLEAYSLQSNAAYTIRCTVTDSLGLQNSAYFSVFVNQGELKAVVMGGDRTVGSGDALLLDGRQSLDLNDPTGNTSSANFNWRVFGGLNFNMANISDRGSMVIFPASVVVAGSYEFTLQLKESDRLSNNVSVAMHVAEETLPEIEILFVLTGKVNADSKLSIPSTVASSASARRRRLQEVSTEKSVGKRQLQNAVAAAFWSLEDGSYSIFNSFSSLEDAALTNLTQRVDEDDEIFNLVIPAGALVGGSSYSFRLEASYTGSSTASSAILTVEVNSPPSSGKIDASPFTGTLLMDTFEINTYDWADDPDDFPLFYRFFYGSGDQSCAEGETSLLQAKSSANTATGLFLPVGNSSVGAEVLDRHEAGAYACASSSLTVTPLPASTSSEELQALVLDATGLALKKNDPVGALNLADIGADTYNSSDAHASTFQTSLVGVLANATELLEASADSIDRLAGSLFGVVSLNTNPEEETLTHMLNLTGTALGWGADLGALQDAAAANLMDVMGATLVVLVPGSGDADKLSNLVNILAEDLAADLVVGEEASELVSEDKVLSMKVGKFSAAASNGQVFTVASSSSDGNTNQTTSAAQISLNTSEALTVALSGFSEDIHTSAKTSNGSSAQLSNMLRISISGAAGALSELKINFKFNNQVAFQQAEVERGSLHCMTGTETLNYTCNSRMYSYNCDNLVGTFNYTCKSDMSAPFCDIHNGTGWSSGTCEVKDYSASDVTCLCPAEGLLSSSTVRRRLTVCDADNNCEEAEAYEADLVANTREIGSEISGNFALADNVLTDVTLVQQNYIVFVTMSTLLVGIPFLACVSHVFHAQKGPGATCCRVGSALGSGLKLRRKLRRMSVLDPIGRHAAQARLNTCTSFSQTNMSETNLDSGELDPAQEFFQELQKKNWEGLKDDILGGNEYLQLFQPATGQTRAITVARVLVVLFTIMFWDCTICAVVFPPGYSDCYFISTESECVNSDLICGWDPYSQGCAPYSLEDTPGTMLFVSALTLAITIPIMAVLEWFMAHTIEAEIPRNGGAQSTMENDEEAVNEDGDASSVSDGWTDPSPLGTSPSPHLTNSTQKTSETLEQEDSWTFPPVPGSGDNRTPSSRSNHSFRSFMRPASRHALLDHKKPGLDSALVDSLVDEQMTAKATNCTVVCLRWLGLGNILRRAIRQDVVLTLNLQERLLEVNGNPQDQDAVLFEAAWCDAMGDRTFALFHKYVVGHDEDSNSNCVEMVCNKPPLTTTAAFWRKFIGWVSMIIYCTVCAFYVCLFGVNYGEDYTVGWLKAFAVGFAEDMLFLSPLLALSTFVAARTLARRPSLQRLRTLAYRPAHYRESAAVAAARRHPDLIVSKVLLDPSFEPPLSWQKRYNVHKDIHDTNHHRLLRAFQLVLTAAALVFLTLPPDIQGTLVQGSGVLALYYGASFCLANTGGGRRGSAYGVIVLAAVFILSLWGYVLTPRKRAAALWSRLRGNQNIRAEQTGDWSRLKKNKNVTIEK